MQYFSIAVWEFLFVFGPMCMNMISENCFKRGREDKIFKNKVFYLFFPTPHEN